MSEKERAMTEYTPTTDEVRERYIDFSINLAAAEGATGFLTTLYVTDKARADFDRWLTEVRREAAEKAWDEGFTRGFHDVLAGGDRDACETSAINPYMKKGDTP